MPVVPTSVAARRTPRCAALFLGAALLTAPAARAQTPGPPASAPASPAGSPTVSEITVEPHCLTFPEAREYWTKHGGEGHLDPDMFTLASSGGKHRTEPSPGTRESLIRFLDSLWAGKPNYDEMSRPLAMGVHNQWDGDKAKVLGKLTAIQFMGVSRLDLDVYAVEYQCAKAIWAVAPLDSSGKVYNRAHLMISYGAVNLLAQH